MNILLINYMETLAPGGINKVVREIAINLSKEHEVTVIQPNPFDLKKEEIFDEFKIIRFNSKRGKYFYNISSKIFFHLEKYLKKLKPDIIHVHGYHTLFSLEVIYLIRKLNFSTPIIFSPHYDIYSHDSFAGKYLWSVHNQLGKKIMQYSNIKIVASNFEAKNIINDLNVKNHEIYVIPHGVDKIELHKKDNRDKNIINLLYVGYLLELKGVQYIIEALNELINKKFVNATLTIVGAGPYERKLKKIAENLNVNQFINWKGFIPPKKVNKLLEHFKKADVVLLLSKSENFGIVVQESLALGTPVIVTNRTALSEFLNEPGCFGVNFPPNPEEVANKILEISSKNIKVGPFSKKIRNWKKVTEEYEIIYQNLLNE